jgi:predicted nucleic acid-binding protein
MKQKVFIDSNIFIYTLDSFDKSKQKKAQEILLAASSEKSIVISTQVLNEIFAVATRKLQANPVYIKEFIHGLYAYDVVLIDKQIIDAAIDCAILQRVNYWDALLIVAADAARCGELLSEDMQQQSKIKGVQVINPFQ